MGYKILEHTADVRIRAQGDSLRELFESAVFGMMEILKPNVSAGAPAVEKIVALEAEDTTALLIDFLNDVLYSACTNKETYDKIIFKKLTPRALEATLFGVPALSFGEDIKAVTYHEADVKQNEQGKWETLLIFDI